MYGDIVKVSQFNGIYNFTGKCRVVMVPKLEQIEKDEGTKDYSSMTDYFSHSGDSAMLEVIPQNGN